MLETTMAMPLDTN